MKGGLGLLAFVALLGCEHVSSAPQEDAGIEVAPGSWTTFEVDGKVNLSAVSGTG